MELFQQLNFSYVRMSVVDINQTSLHIFFKILMNAHRTRANTIVTHKPTAQTFKAPSSVPAKPVTEEMEKVAQVLYAKITKSRG